MWNSDKDDSTQFNKILLAVLFFLVSVIVIFLSYGVKKAVDHKYNLENWTAACTEKGGMLLSTTDSYVCVSKTVIININININILY